MEAYFRYGIKTKKGNWDFFSLQFQVYTYLIILNFSRNSEFTFHARTHFSEFSLYLTILTFF